MSSENQGGNKLPSFNSVRTPNRIKKPPQPKPQPTPQPTPASGGSSSDQANRLKKPKT